ncbi:hypothetical protein [Sinomonas notoginsengisoli]|uniref:hypothetical protein n=1 Tax=Sinomonas notoginsengisoli TaxID=1457311 RepID=UPI001F287662|nr:hypothetical protein [Sinomonas notoginsengisoli]
MGTRASESGGGHDAQAGPLRDLAYAEGHAAGFAEGRTAGFIEGRTAGFAEGRAEGHRVGYLEGHRAGWEQAVRSPAVRPLAVAPPAAQPTVPAAEAARYAIVPQPEVSGPHRPDVPAGARPKPTPTPEQVAAEAARRREQRGIQSANIALYAAALLIVAAAGLFLASSVADHLRLAGLAGVTALFYAAGLVVHARFPRLRPAAVAFAGTGLALLPVTGLGLDLVVLHDPSMSWLVTSAVGLVAFGFAALRLESRVLVFLSLTFLFSAAWSGTEVLGGALAADFAALITAAALLAAISALQPRWVPPLFLRPIARLHPFVVPSTFVAATVAAGTLERWQYPVLVLAMSVYLVAESFLAEGVTARRLSWWGARTTAVLAAGVGAAQAVDAGAVFGTLPWPPMAAAAVAASAATIVLTLVSAVLGAAREEQLGLSRRGARAEQAVAVVVQVALVVVASLSVGQVTHEPAFVAAALAAPSAQFTAWRWGKQAEWLPLLAFAELLLVRLDAWPLAVLSTAGCMYFAARALWTASAASAPQLVGAADDDVNVWGRPQFLAMARLASLVAVPAVVAALGSGLPPSEKTAAVAFSLVAAVAVQLAVTGLLGALGRAEFLRTALVWVLGTIAVCAVLAVGWSDLRFSRYWGPTSISPLFIPAVFVLCAGAVALAVGLYLARPPARRAVSVGEVAPGVLLGVVSLEAFLFTAGELARPMQGTVNGVLAIAAAVFAASAWRAPAGLRRWAYIWLARGAATLLVAGSFRWLELGGWAPTVFGQRFTLEHVVVLAVLVQIVVPLAVEIRGVRRSRRLPWTLADAAAVLALAAPGTVGAALETGLGSHDAVTPIGAILVVAFAVAAALAGGVLRFHQAAAALAPAALVLTAIAASRDVRMLEILVGLFAAFSAAMVYLAPQWLSKGAHLVAARALPVALAVLVAQDATASETWISVVLAVGLAAQHVLRRLLPARTAALPFHEAVYWSGLVGQLALPLGYLLVTRQGAEGGRWVVLFEAGLVVVSAVSTLRGRPAAGYVGAAALLLGVVALGPLLHFPAGQFLTQAPLDGTAVALVLAALSWSHLAGMGLWENGRRQGDRTRPWPWTAAAAAFGAASIQAGLAEKPAVLGVGVATTAAVLIAASYVWRRARWEVAAAFPLGVLLTLPAGMLVARDLVDGLPAVWQDPVTVLGGTLVPAALGVALRWSGRWPGAAGSRLEELGLFRADPVRHWTLIGAAGAALALSVRAAWEPPAVVLVPALAMALVAVAVPELSLRARRLGAEVGAIVLVAAFQRAVFAEAVEEPGGFWLAQWYVVTAAVVALLRYYVGKQVVPGRAWLEGAATLLSLTGIWVAATAGNNAQQIWLLVAFAVLTLAGLALGERRFTAWGAAGVVACVLWSVRVRLCATGDPGPRADRRSRMVAGPAATGHPAAVG